MNEIKNFKMEFENLNITNDASFTTDGRARALFRVFGVPEPPKDRTIIAVVYTVKSDADDRTFLAIFLVPKTHERYRVAYGSTNRP